MKLDIFRTLWGYTGQLEDVFDGLQNAGFDGIEARLPEDAAGRERLGRLLAAHETPYICILFSSTPVLPRQSDTPEAHLRDLERKLEWAAELAPRFVNLLAGNDRWSLAEQVDFHGAVMALARQAGIECSFETHRARSLYSPWVTLDLIRQLPDIQFTSDISHWVVVCERLLDDAQDDLTPFIERVRHIQARVGYDQGPQVPHPAAPEYAATLAFHQRHWESIWLSQQRRGFTTTTLTPEFGADGYLHHLPFTDVPVADLWSLNQWMAREERQHFQRFIGH